MAGLTPKEARELWAQALESGQYKRGTGRLTTVTDEGEFDCCLGVACKLAIEHGVIVAYDGSDGALQGYQPVQQWLGLRDYGGAYASESGILGRSLTADNDAGTPFPSIAATIRAEPDGLVVA